jgi:hypothetical protein
VLVVALRLPDSDNLFKEVAHATGLSPADVRLRLSGPLPRVLAVESDAERARAMSAALEVLGFVTVVCDPRAAPGDDDRLVARTLDFGPGGLTVGNDLVGDEQLSATSLALIQKGVRIATTTEVSKKSERRIDLTRAVLTGGLILTKKVETQSTKTTTSQDRFVLLHRNDGGRDLILYERRIDYRFLGSELVPSSAVNFDRMVARLRGWAPRAPYDDRVARPGFISGLLATSAPPVDLALWLVQFAHIRGVA